MALFPDRLIEDMRRLPGGEHTFLHQLCSAQGAAHRQALEEIHLGLGPVLQERVEALLGSLDNRRFFQGYSEALVMRILSASGFSVQDLAQPGPILLAESPTRGPIAISVLGFIHRQKSSFDGPILERLLGALDRIPGRDRILLVIHRLPRGEFDTEPIRRAVEGWLMRLKSGEWKNRQASYEDKERDIHLEFCLTRERSRTGRHVCAWIGPFWSPASISAVDSRVVAELESWRMSPPRERPLVLACVADQPWCITPGYLRDFLYGRPARVETFSDGAHCELELEFANESSPSIFRDPLYHDLSAFMLVGREPEKPRSANVQVFLNPWAKTPLRADFFPESRVLAPDYSPGRTVLRWVRRESGNQQILL